MGTTTAQKAAAAKAAKDAAETPQDSGPAVTDPPANDETATPKVAAEDSFPLDRILGADGDQITGHPSHIVAGALAGHDGSPLTSAQVDQFVKAFLNRAVSIEGDL